MPSDIEILADRIALYKARAAEMRRIARDTEHPEMRLSLLALAAQWESLAEHAPRPQNELGH